MCESERLYACECVCSVYVLTVILVDLEKLERADLSKCTFSLFFLSLSPSYQLFHSLTASVDNEGVVEKGKGEFFVWSPRLNIIGSHTNA